MTLESSKTLGGVGAILVLIGPIGGAFSIPYLSVLSLIGVILILIALYGLANFYQDKGIFNNALYGFIAGIVGAAVAVAVLVADVLDNLNNLKNVLEQIYPSWNGQWSSISSIRGMSPQTSNLDLSPIVPFIEVALAALVILWVFLVIWAIFARKSLRSVATKSGIGLFSTASLLLLIGAALTIIVIGAILMWVAVLLMAIAFFQLKPQAEQPPVTYMPPPTQPTPV